MIEDATPTDEKPKRLRWSASRLQMWMNCQMQAKFRYIDHLPSKQGAAATFGSCVHKAFEVYAQTRDVDLACARFTAYWTHPSSYGIPEPEVWYRGQTFGGYMAKGLEAIRGYHTQARWKTRDLVATEHGFVVPFGKYELTGFVDLLEVAKNSKGQRTLEITDIKTNAKKPYVTNLKVNPQFSLYDYASRRKEFWVGGVDPAFPAMVNGEWWWEMTKDLPRTNIWYGAIQASSWNAGNRDQADFDRLYRVMQEIERALEHNVFVPSISGDTCGYCPYTEPCRLPFDPNEVWETDVDII